MVTGRARAAGRFDGAGDGLRPPLGAVPAGRPSGRVHWLFGPPFACACGAHRAESGRASRGFSPGYTVLLDNTA